MHGSEWEGRSVTTFSTPNITQNLEEPILQEGFYVARIHDQVFELDIPDNFQPRPY